MALGAFALKRQQFAHNTRMQQPHSEAGVWQSYWTRFTAPCDRHDLDKSVQDDKVVLRPAIQICTFPVFQYHFSKEVQQLEVSAEFQEIVGDIQKDYVLQR